MGLSVVTAPTETSISLDLAKQNSRVRHSVEDDLFDLYIAAADRYIENYAQIALLPQTWELTVQCISGDVLEVPLPPLRSITSVSYDDAAGATQAFTDYKLGDQDGVAVLRVDSTTPFPLVDGVTAPLKIRFEAGYNDADAVPADIRQCALLLASHFYQNREATMADGRVMNISKAVEFGVKDLLARHRVLNVHAFNRPVNA